MTTIRADDAHAQIAEIHDAVISRHISLDARTQGRLLEMLHTLAVEIVADQRNSGGDPVVTLVYLSAIETAKDNMPDAIEEMRMDVDAWERRQMALRRAYRAGLHIGSRIYEIV